MSVRVSGYGYLAAPEADNAEAHYRRGAELRSCKRFDEALAAFDRAIALKSDYAEAHNGRGIVLASVGRFDQALVSLESAIAVKPSYAEAYNNRGIVLQDLKRLDEALASFDKAIALKPDNAQTHNNRGTALQDLNRAHEAIASFDAAIALKPDYAEATFNRATALHALQRFAEAIAGFEKAISLKPDYADAYNNLGLVLQDLRRLEDAMAAYDKAIALRPGLAGVYVNKSYCLLQMGRFAEGWRLHEWRTKLETPVGNRSLPQALWLGREDISGKTLFVHCEQGLGDTLQFCRYGKLLAARGIQVMMSVQRPLYRLLKHCLDVQVLDQDEVPAAYDYHCPMMSLPLALGTTLDAVPSECPYIFADPQLRRAWENRLPGPATRRDAVVRLRIGIVWSGNAEQKNDRNRSIGLAALAPLLSAGPHWISLQKDIRPGDEIFIRQLGIAHYGDQLDDLADTAALIDALDLVIAVDTSVAHLVGAMGKPLWMMLAYCADWRWLLDRDDTSWYPSARLFRQDDERSWQKVIPPVAAALRDLLQSR